MIRRETPCGGACRAIDVMRKQGDAPSRAEEQIASAKSGRSGIVNAGPVHGHRTDGRCAASPVVNNRRRQTGSSGSEVIDTSTGKVAAA